MFDALFCFPERRIRARTGATRRIHFTRQLCASCARYGDAPPNAARLAFRTQDMVLNPHPKPRRHATQERSRATVDALVEATARVLVKEGFGGTSTNRIAETAGVSVG